MKRQRVPYARRSAWTVIAILAVVVVAGCVIAGYEIHHLQSQVDAMQTQLNGLNSEISLLSKIIYQLKQLAK